jgi:predicted nucleotidyltransferase
MQSDNIKNLLQPILEKYRDKIISAYLFGTGASGEMHPLSDIDIALLFSEKTLLRVWKRLAAKSPELAKLNTSVDQERNRFIGINKTSVRKFKRLIQDSDFRRLVYKEIAFQRWYLKALHKIPLLKEVLTIEIIAVLKKENESHRDGLVEIS